MGKIRVKSFGDQEEEEKAKRRSAKRAEKKKLKAESESTEEPQDQSVSEQPEAKTEEKEEKTKKKSKKSSAPRERSGKYKAAAIKIDNNRQYSPKEALELLETVHLAKFDETVELHINTLTGGISGQVTLPHGSGKKTRVAIADEALIAEIEKGNITFDILVASPQIMPKLAKVAKVLGPRGLMPNPKNGTITATPEDLVKKYEGGQMNFKTEAKSPIIHLSVGKLSFGPEKLSENIEIALKAVKKNNIRNTTLKSTMSPGIKLRA